MVNDYLHAACSNGQVHEFSAKDFRTWGGTVHAARILACTPRPRKDGEQARRGALAKAVGEVAAILGKTPAVCRGSYIHPRVLEGWLDGSLQRAIPPAMAAHPRKLEQAGAALPSLKSCRWHAATTGNPDTRYLAAQCRQAVRRHMPDRFRQRDHGRSDVSGIRPATKAPG